MRMRKDRLSFDANEQVMDEVLAPGRAQSSLSSYHKRIRYFGDRTLWSSTTLACKGIAPYGAVARGDSDGIRLCLARKGGDSLAWHRVWRGVPTDFVELGHAAAAKSYRLTASEHYLPAGNYYYTNERMTKLSEFKSETCRHALRFSHAGCARPYPKIEKVEMPCEGGTFSANYMKSNRASGPGPTVVVFDGRDRCK